MSYLEQAIKIINNTPDINKSAKKLGIDIANLINEADIEIADLKDQLEPFKDLIRIEPQPDTFDMIDGILHLYSRDGVYHHYAPERMHHVKINSIWYWSL